MNETYTRIRRKRERQAKHTLLECVQTTVVCEPMHMYIAGAEMLSQRSTRSEQHVTESNIAHMRRFKQLLSVYVSVLSSAHVRTLHRMNLIGEPMPLFRAAAHEKIHRLASNTCSLLRTTFVTSLRMPFSIYSLYGQPSHHRFPFIFHLFSSDSLDRVRF